MPVEFQVIFTLLGFLGAGMLKYADPISVWLGRNTTACAQLMKKSSKKNEIPVPAEAAPPPRLDPVEHLIHSSEVDEWGKMMILASEANGREGVERFLREYPISISDGKKAPIGDFISDDLVVYLSDHPEQLYFLEILLQFEKVVGFEMARSFDVLKGWKNASIRMSGDEFNAYSGTPLSEMFNDPTRAKKYFQEFTATRTTPNGNQVSLSINGIEKDQIRIMLFLKRMPDESNSALNERALKVRDRLAKKSAELWKGPPGTTAPNLILFQLLPEHGMRQIEGMPIGIDTPKLDNARAYIDYLLSLP